MSCERRSALLLFRRIGAYLLRFCKAVDLVQEYDSAAVVECTVRLFVERTWERERVPSGETKFVLCLIKNRTHIIDTGDGGAKLLEDRV